ncbi:YtxH domain-containing protein [Rhodococcus sp. T2V]|uniref:YtxH domain-containing protein n=1 Tax=Rhodococcus sp. T2V TaxID=3034164 RepID=UPI0023E19C8C|nr:YtxH domain-containing protein [Rhodococcus sp. T2V]MDF3313535.1 YtxH domain-containing protein [Rhodococcus sp. T2V]
MEKALIFATGVAVGFVAGTRAGRQTYEKMRNQSLELWHNPTVQEKVSDAAHVVKDKAPQVQQKVGALAKKATHRGHTTSADIDSGTAAADVHSSTAGPRDRAAVVATPAVTEPTVPPATTAGRHTLDPG